jgi:hypothetical protein
MGGRGETTEDQSFAFPLFFLSYRRLFLNLAFTNPALKVRGLSKPI